IFRQITDARQEYHQRIPLACITECKFPERLMSRQHVNEARVRQGQARKQATLEAAITAFQVIAHVESGAGTRKSDSRLAALCVCARHRYPGMPAGRARTA